MLLIVMLPFAIINYIENLLVTNFPVLSEIQEAVNTASEFFYGILSIF